MKTEDLSTLKINKLTQAQYDKALKEGRINENELYLTPDNIGVNGLPENAEFKNLTINDGYNGKIYLEGGNSDGRISAGMLSLGYKEEEGNYRLTYMPEDGIEMHQDNYAIYLIDGHIGLENENARAYINLNNELIEDIEVYLPNKSGTLATLDDIGTGGGSLPTNPIFESVKVGDISINNNNISITSEVASGETKLYHSYIETPKLNSPSLCAKSGFELIKLEYDCDVVIGKINKTTNIDFYSTNKPTWNNKQLLVADEYYDDTYVISEDLTTMGKLRILSDNGDIPNAPSTNDIDATFYAQGIAIEDCDTGDTNYLYFPQKTGTLATLDDIQGGSGGSSDSLTGNTFEDVVFDRNDFTFNEEYGAYILNLTKDSKVTLNGFILEDNIIVRLNGYKFYLHLIDESDVTGTITFYSEDEYESNSLCLNRLGSIVEMLSSSYIGLTEIPENSLVYFKNNCWYLEKAIIDMY